MSRRSSSVLLQRATLSLRLWSFLLFFFFSSQLLLPSSISGVEAKKFKIGVIYDSLDVTDLQALGAAYVALEDYEKDPDFPKDTEFELDPISVGGAADANNAALKFAKDDDVIAVLGPSYSSHSLVAGITLSNAELPTITYSATSTALSDKAIYPFYMRSIPSDAQQAQALVDIVNESFDWKFVGILSATEAYSLGLSQEFITLAQSKGVKLVSTIYFPDGDTDFEDELLNMRRTGVRIILAVMQADVFRTLFPQARENEMTGPPYVYVTPDSISSLNAIFDSKGKLDKELLEAWAGSIATNPYIGNQDSKDFKAFFKKLDEYLKKNEELEKGRGPIYTYTTYSYDAALTIVKAVTKVLKDGDDPSEGKKLLKAMKSIKFNGLTGRVEYDSDGERRRGSFSLSNVRREDGGSVDVVGRWTNETGLKISEDPVWPTGNTSPIPDDTPQTTIKYFNCKTQERLVDTRGYVVLDPVEGDPLNIDDKSYCDSVIDCNNWSDEGFDCSPSLSIAFIAIGILAVILSIIVFLGMLIIWYYRKAGRIRASGISFLMSIGVAAIVGILAVFTFYGKAQTYVCIIQIWVLSVPSAIMIGALATKQYRVWKVFGNRSLKTVIVTEKQLLLMTFFFLVPDVIILIIWSAVDPPSRQLTNGKRHVECGNDSEEVFLIILAVYKGFLLFVSSVLAILTRKMPSAFSEAKLVGFALYNSTLVSAIVIPIIIVLQDEEFFSWILTVLFILFFFFSTFAILAFPKIYGLLVIDRKKSTTERNKIPTYIKGGSGATSSHTHSNKTT